MFSDTLTQIQTSIQAASNAAANKKTQKPKGVTLLAVSKKQTAESITALYESGQRHFGENYVQEAVDKQDKLTLHPEIVWHFIGPLQSNKTRIIAERFSWVHSIDRLKIAQRLSKQRPPSMESLNVCIQVNIDDEDSKSGTTINEAGALAKNICSLSHLCLRGLMIIPAPNANKQSHDAAHSFVMAKELFDAIKVTLNNDSTIPKDAIKHFDTLSMGMSNDYEQAIEHGATIVRIGTKLFGARS